MSPPQSNCRRLLATDKQQIKLDFFDTETKDINYDSPEIYSTLLFAAGFETLSQSESLNVLQAASQSLVEITSGSQRVGKVLATSHHLNFELTMPRAQIEAL